MSVVTVKAILRTRCGCSQEKEVPYPPPPFLRLRLKLAPYSMTQQLKATPEYRTFELQEFTEEFAEYEERAT